MLPDEPLVFQQTIDGLVRAEAALEVSGAKEPRVALARREGAWTVFDVRWS